MHVCMFACMHACMYACLHVCMFTCMHACMYACLHVCMFACMHECMHVCMHVCMVLCMYISYSWSVCEKYWKIQGPQDSSAGNIQAVSMIGTIPQFIKGLAMYLDHRGSSVWEQRPTSHATLLLMAIFWGAYLPFMKKCQSILLVKKKLYTIVSPQHAWFSTPIWTKSKPSLAHKPQSLGRPNSARRIVHAAKLSVIFFVANGFTKHGNGKPSRLHRRWLLVIYRYL